MWVRRIVLLLHASVRLLRVDLRPRRSLLPWVELSRLLRVLLRRLSWRLSMLHAVVVLGSPARLHVAKLSGWLLLLLLLPAFDLYLGFGFDCRLLLRL